MHMLPLQVPDVHVAPAQQGSPLMPHRVHCDVPVTVAHTVSDSVHVLPGQHGSPSRPHEVHVEVLAWQKSPELDVDPGHVNPGQHGSPSLPQVSQKPSDAHTCWLPPLDEQVPPRATQALGVADVSQHPLVHCSPTQHGWPGPPHA